MKWPIDRSTVSLILFTLILSPLANNFWNRMLGSQDMSEITVTELIGLILGSLPLIAILVYVVYERIDRRRNQQRMERQRLRERIDDRIHILEIQILLIEEFGRAWGMPDAYRYGYIEGLRESQYQLRIQRAEIRD